MYNGSRISAGEPSPDKVSHPPSLKCISVESQKRHNTPPVCVYHLDLPPTLSPIRRKNVRYPRGGTGRTLILVVYSFPLDALAPGGVRGAIASGSILTTFMSEGKKTCQRLKSELKRPSERDMQIYELHKGHETPQTQKGWSPLSHHLLDSFGAIAVPEALPVTATGL